MAEVVLEKVVKQYPGGVIAVRDFDLHIGDGELMVLVGPSGCGKTTTLRMIAGLEEITSGTLSIGGKVVNDVPPRDRDIAMVFQSYALYPHMTVEENMSFGLRLRRMPKAEITERVQAAAQLLGIEELLSRKPKALSGGQRQRVAMGRAIVRQPSVFLFDEPLSNLDAKLRVQMRVEIAGLHRRLGTTVVYVTHDQVEAMTLADRIAIMSDGVLQQHGAPLEVYHRPQNLFVAGFIGSPAMNFIEGRLKKAGTGLAFEGGGFDVPLSAKQVAALGDASLGAGATVTLGIRPQHLGHVENGNAAARGRVKHVELMGAESFVHLEMEGATAEDGVVIARFRGDRQVEVGASVPLAVDQANIHLFDGAGESLLLDCIEVADTGGGQ